MDVLGGANQVELNLFRTQNDESKQMRELASGLRVNSAVDDPSGLSIASTIQSRVSGLQQGVQDVQEGSTLLEVADGVLNTVQLILQRIHSLIVQAASDLNSPQQLESIQTEMNQLLAEIDQISQRATFNGVHLLDGSLSNALAGTPYVEFIQPDLNPDGSIASTQVHDENNTGGNDPGPLIFQDGPTLMYGTTPGSVSGYTEIQIIGYSDDPNTTYTGPLGQPGVYAQVTQYSTDPNFGGTDGAKEQISLGAFTTNTGIDQGLGAGNPLIVQSANGLGDMLTFGLANLSASDVGTAVAVETFNGSAAGTGSPLTINTGGSEGSNISISLPAVSTSALQINGISILDPQEVDVYNNPIGTGSNVNAVDDAEARVENALNLIGQTRAQVGAQAVAMQEEATNNTTAIANETASASMITDADIGSATTAFTKDQVLSNIGISVLAQMQADAQLVIQLIGNVTPTGAGLV